MIEAEAGVATVSISKVIPERIDLLSRVQRSNGIRPTLSKQRFCQRSRQNRLSEQYGDKSGNPAAMISRTRSDARN